MYSKIYLVFQNEEKIDFQMYVIHFNCQNLKTLLLKILVIKNDFCQENCVVYIFSPLPVAKYEPIWTDFTAQTVILGANLLVKAKTIPQNAKCA